MDHYQKFRARRLQSLLAQEDLVALRQKGADRWWKKVPKMNFDKNLPKVAKDGEKYKFKDADFKEYIYVKQA